MYLKRIEINGFKSFANKTVLNLEKGITAIVGPNGSGKSNVADAIKWVLGEQSAKLLRGKKGEDVIFAGSEKKAQVSTASVFLVFDNKDKKIPLEFEEVIIGRKIFRDGTGQYLLNGSKVRLADIIENMAASGIGKGDYSVVNQGMADKILASTPLERRFMLEEASGIKQFRIKRDQAEKKLEATNQNISRIFDLLSEIKPRLKFLRKQSAKAEKRGEIEKLLKENQQEYFTARLFELKKEKSRFDSRIQAIIEKIEQEKSRLSELERSLKKEAEKESFGQERAAEVRKNLQELSVKRREAEKETAILEGRADLLKRQILDKNEKIKFLEKEQEDKFRSKKNLGQPKSDEKILVSKKKLKALIEVLESSESQDSAESIKSALQKALGFLRKIVEIEKENIQLPAADTRLIDGQIERLKKEISSDAHSKKKIEIELLSKKTILDNLEKEIEENEAEIFRIGREGQKRSSKFFALEREARLKRDELDELRSRESGIKIEESRVLVHLEDLEKEARSEVGTDFNPSVSAVDAEGNISALESNIRKYKAQLDQIGGIDDLTIHEHQETENRFASLSKEFIDLENAKKNLKDLVLDLDKQMEKKFSQSFKTIEDEFEKYFKMIFGGGSAKIFYSKIKENSAGDEGGESINSPDNIGIEIAAIPPGKKNKSLSVLSGGERSLASIALLFAIIANSQPPFCVLDEVDAALDEANSSRIGPVFKELSEKTQFIIITHNREIMRQSAALYGITMQKDGISRLLSVKLTS